MQSRRKEPFCPDRHVEEDVFSDSDWGHVRKEMAEVDSNLRLLLCSVMSLKRDTAPIQYVIQYVIHSIIKIHTHLNERQPICPCLKDLCR